MGSVTLALFSQPFAANPRQFDITLRCAQFVMI